MKLTNYRLDIFKLRLRLSQCRIEMHYKAVFVEELDLLNFGITIRDLKIRGLGRLRGRNLTRFPRVFSQT